MPVMNKKNYNKNITKILGKSQQKKRRKKRKRVTRMKYENIDRTQWIFLPRQKRGGT